MVRKKPFTDIEKSLLKELIREREIIISCKETGSNITRKKQETWSNIAKKFNSSQLVTERVTVKQIKKYWLNIKARDKDAKTKENVIRMTGGRPAIPVMDPDDEDTLGIIQNVLPAVSSNDCDNFINTEADKNVHSWKHLKNEQPIKIKPNIKPPFIILKKSEVGNFNARLIKGIKKTYPVPSNSAQLVAGSSIEPQESSPVSVEKKRNSLEYETPVVSGVNKKILREKHVLSVEELNKEIIENDLIHRKNMNKQAEEHDKAMKNMAIETQKMILEEHCLRVEEQQYKTLLAKFSFESKTAQEKITGKMESHITSLH